MGIRIKAAEGQRVRDERSELLPVEGVVIAAMTPYWQRRLNDKEIVVTPEEMPAAPEAHDSEQ